MAKRKAATTRKTARARKTTPGRKKAANRDLIDTGTDKRYVRRNPKGQFKESDDVGPSWSADRRRRAKTKAKRDQGEKGDRSCSTDDSSSGGLVVLTVRLSSSAW